MKNNQKLRFILLGAAAAAVLAAATGMAQTREADSPSAALQAETQAEDPTEALSVPQTETEWESQTETASTETERESQTEAPSTETEQESQTGEEEFLITPDPDGEDQETDGTEEETGLTVDGIAYQILSPAAETDGTEDAGLGEAVLTDASAFQGEELTVDTITDGQGDGYRVVRIAAGAFRGLDLAKVTIGKSVQEIEDGAFADMAGLDALTLTVASPTSGVLEYLETGAADLAGTDIFIDFQP